MCVCAKAKHGRLFRKSFWRIALNLQRQTLSRVLKPLVSRLPIRLSNTHPGNKKDNITVIYTPWSNLKKDGSMAVGQVGFKDNKKVKRVYVEKRENSIVNRLNKTKVEKHPDLRQEKADREKELRKKDQASRQARVGYPWRFTLNGREDADEYGCSKRKKLVSQRSERSLRTKEITCTMTSIQRTLWRHRATRTATQTSWTTSCRR